MFQSGDLIHNNEAGLFSTAILRNHCYLDLIQLVREGGFEPPHLTAQVPKTYLAYFAKPQKSGLWPMK